MLKLYDYYRSSAAYRVRIALNLKNLAHDVIPIHLINNGGEQHSEAYQAINPLQLVPALVDGNHVLTQSLAIIEYLNDTHPDIPLLPSDPYQKALVRAFSLTIVADTHPLNNLRVLNRLKSEFAATDEQTKAWIQNWVAKGLTALETQLSRQENNNKFCFGNKPTLADICLIPQIFNARRFNCDLSHYPKLVAIDAECQKLDAFMKASPKEPVT